MNKNLLFTMSFVLCALVLQAQNPVPNPSFENWTSGNPDNWLTNNAVGAFVPITQVNTGNTGSKACKGEVVSFQGSGIAPVLYSSPGGSGNGFPVSQTYNNMRFYYKFNPAAAGDEIEAFAVIQDGSGTGVGSAFLTINTAATIFTQANAPIIAVGPNPANAVITISIGNVGGSGSPAIGSYFIVDDVSLNNAASIQENSMAGLDNIYPNPSGNTINIPFHQQSSGVVKIKIYDLQGRLMKDLLNENQGAGSYKLVENISDLENGIYQCSFESQGQLYSTLFQVQH